MSTAVLSQCSMVEGSCSWHLPLGNCHCHHIGFERGGGQREDAVMRQWAAVFHSPTGKDGVRLTTSLYNALAPLGNCLHCSLWFQRGLCGGGQREDGISLQSSIPQLGKTGSGRLQAFATPLHL